MKARKILAMVMALALTAALAVGGTLAYLTSTKTVTNTFTVGRVGITLTESPVNPDGTVKTGDRVTANEYHLMPGHTYTKDPTIYVDSDSEESYLFVKVENGLSNVEVKAADTEHDTIAEQMSADWRLVEGTTNVYIYKNTVTKSSAPITVFSSFTLADDADLTGLATVKDDTTGAITGGASIIVTAYAIQADGFENSTPADIWAKF